LREEKVRAQLQTESIKHFFRLAIRRQYVTGSAFMTVCG
jgi:hypothetical protein